MFKKKYTIEGKVNKGFLIESGVIILQTKSFLKKINISNGELIIDSEIKNGLSYQTIEKLPQGYLGLASGKITFLEENLKEKETKSIRYAGYYLYENKYITEVLDYNYTTFKGKYGLHELSTGIILWEADTWENIKIESGVAFTVSPDHIDRRDILNGSKKWNLRIDNKNLVPEVIGISDDIVIFGLQEVDKLLAINIETGSIKWEVDTFAKGLCIDKERNLLHQLLVNYAAFDLSSGELKENYRDNTYFESVGIESQRSNFALAGGHLITTDWQKGNIGAFNLITHKFDWIHREEDIFFPSPKPIEYHDPYLFLHDNNDTLHIFEKE
jgi:hypothetical protein